MTMGKHLDRVRDGLRQGLEIGKELLGQAGHQARTLEEDIKARREIDVEGMVAGLRARLAEKLQLEPLPIDADLAERRLPVGLGRVRTEAWRCERLRKVVLSHVTVPGVIDGLALTALPVFELDFPCFAADLMALPWRFSVNVDVYGRDWQTRDTLRSLRTTFFRLGGDHDGPLWAAKLASGHGLHAKLRPRQIEEGFAGLSQGLATYLGELENAPPGRSNEAQEQFFLTFHTHGPKNGMLRRLFGDEWAERYSRLIFE